MQGECQAFCSYFHFLNAELAVFPLRERRVPDLDAVLRFITGFLQSLCGASARCRETSAGVIGAVAASSCWFLCSCLLCPGLSSPQPPHLTARCVTVNPDAFSAAGCGRLRAAAGWGWQLWSRAFQTPRCKFPARSG